MSPLLSLLLALRLLPTPAALPSPHPATPPASTNAPVPALLPIAPGVFELCGVRLDKNQRTVRFPGFVNMNAGAMEYALVGSTGKIHESVLRTDIQPIHLHTALLLLNVKDTTPRLAPGQIPPPRAATRCSSPSSGSPRARPTASASKTPSAIPSPPKS